MNESVQDAKESGKTRENASSSSQNLALVRTDLANERTLLAYGRTALMVAGTGVSLVKFFPLSQLFQILGWSFVVIGVAVGAIGLSRFVRLRRRLRSGANG